MSSVKALREEAARRAATTNGNSHFHPPSQSYGYQQQQYNSQQQHALGLHPSDPSPMIPGGGTYSQHQYQQQYQQQPEQYQQTHGHLAQQHAQQLTAPPLQSQQPDVQDVRQAWRKYGSRLTQQLEDVRVPPVNGRPTDLAAKVVSATPRTDPAQKTYTSYVVQLWYPHVAQQNQQAPMSVERRYSDFWKFKESLNDVPNLAIPVPFPSKQAWFRKSDERVIQDRVTQLDAWLVYVVRAFNQGVLRDTTGFLAAQPLALPFQQQVTTNKHNIHNPFSCSLASGLRQAHFTLAEWANSSTATLPPPNITAIACLTLAQAGCLVTGRIGTGVLFRRLPHQNGSAVWSAPVAVQTVGVGVGAGGAVTHGIVLWDTPVTADTTLWTVPPAIYTIQNKGGLLTQEGWLEGSVVKVREQVNATFYGRTVATSQLLQTDGDAHVPAAQPVYQQLRLLLGTT